MTETAPPAGQSGVPDMLWQPSGAPTTIDTFTTWLREHRGLELNAYAELHTWSVTEPAEFWAAFAEYSGIVFHDRPREILVGEAMPDVEWFPGATINYAEHALAAARTDAASSIAITAVREDGTDHSVSCAELARRVALVQRHLIDAGVGKGDVVAALAPNIVETVVAFLATAGLGAIWSCCSPDFGAKAVIDRFTQIEPKVLFAVDGYSYGGTRFDVTSVVAEIIGSIDSLVGAVHIAYDDTSGTTLVRSDTTPVVAWDNIVTADRDAEPIFEPVPFSHPLWILYSSGTTGIPKGIVHSHGGIVLEHKKALHLQFGLDGGDRLFWFTTTGWMMWNLVVSGLLVGAEVVLFDGNPGYPDLDTLWALAARHRVSVFGVSAAYLHSCAKRGLNPGRSHDLSSLTMVAATGSPLSPDGFRWVADAVGADLPVVSSSGGTDVCSAFLGGAPTVPVWIGEISCAALGAAVSSFDVDGRPVIGEVGELVVTAPMPSMPITLWNDSPDKKRLRATYFDHFPGVWRHGDWVVITDRGTAVIHGRSDSTLNRGGIRIGTADIYSVVEGFAEVLDSLVVDTATLHTAGEMLCLLVLEGPPASDIEARLRAEIKAQLSPRHVPDRFVVVDDLPHTLNGKKCEVPVKRILAGTPVDDAVSRSSLRNPDAIDSVVAACRQ
ncbi:acetoacetate--CoA ligase [Gordonia polyisoprenivorans]|uniref:acetoacetate--CoA ligase n=1 Tax=Gordonia polyisoprenivorans TaxID=84595 RepID=UPI001AD6A500|nr:acetoacetate--CoA ligase [Gordonia polyisoprenivorans]QTI69009.1 acetoacetate--CoA ligase [Gordonia polyisoprenivorans]